MTIFLTEGISKKFLLIKTFFSQLDPFKNTVFLFY